MKTRTILTGLFMSVAFSSLAQQQSRSSASVNPCPGGTGTAEIETSSPGRLYQLAGSSELIVVGTVAGVLPAFATSPEHLTTIETDSLISVKQRLYGTLPSGTTTITLGQLGGKAGPCGVFVPDDPLVAFGEEYVLFLRTDTRTQTPNTSGFARYSAVGVWSGKVKVVNGKVQFLPRANPVLHKYDNTDLNAFLADLSQIIDILHPKK